MPFPPRPSPPAHSNPTEFAGGFGHQGVHHGSFNPSNNFFSMMDALGVSVLDENRTRKNTSVTVSRRVPVGTIDNQGKPIRSALPPDVTVLRGVQLAVKEVRANYNVKSYDCLLKCNSNSGAFTVNLPNATDLILGQLYYFVKTNGAPAVITIAAQAGDSINGAASIVLANMWDFWSLVCIDAATWAIMARRP